MVVLTYWFMASLNFRDQKLKNTWNDKVVVNPTLNPFFSPGSEWRTQSLDLEKVLYPI